jgi:hypothetical protein
MADTKELINQSLQKFIQGIRLIEGFEPITELWNLICPLFGDTRVIQRTGLIKQFNILKVTVDDRKLIGLIIYGANINDDLDRIVDDYPTQDGRVITLTLRSICKALLNDHMTDDEIISLLNNC